MGAVPPKSKRKPVEEVLEDTSPEVTSWRKGSQVLWNQVGLVIQMRYSQGHSTTLFKCSRDNDNMSMRSIFCWEFQSALLMEPWNPRITGHHLTISGSPNLKVTWGWCWSQDSHHQHHRLIQPKEKSVIPSDTVILTRHKSCWLSCAVTHCCWVHGLLGCCSWWWWWPWDMQTAAVLVFRRYRKNRNNRKQQHREHKTSQSSQQQNSAECAHGLVALKQVRDSLVLG